MVLLVLGLFGRKEMSDSLMVKKNLLFSWWRILKDLDPLY